MGMRTPGHRRTDRAASAVEYALLVAGIAAVVIVAVGVLGTAVAGWFQRGYF